MHPGELTLEKDSQRVVRRSAAKAALRSTDLGTGVGTRDLFGNPLDENHTALSQLFSSAS